MVPYRCISAQAARDSMLLAPQLSPTFQGYLLPLHSGLHTKVYRLTPSTVAELLCTTTADVVTRQEHNTKVAFLLGRAHVQAPPG